MALRNKKSITISLSDEVYERIDNLAVQKSRSKSSIIEELVLNGIDLESSFSERINKLEEEMKDALFRIAELEYSADN